MSSAVTFPTVYSDQAIDSFHHPLFNSDAIPYAYNIDSRPSKRTRNGTEVQVDTSDHDCENREEPASLLGVTENFPPQQVNSVLKQDIQQSASVQPRSKRGRKKKSKLNPQDGPFIQETFAFPKRQTWLKVKSRRRKPPIDVEPTQEVPIPVSTAPREGEDLCLDKHADHIAALITQKRRENESKLFRERMSLQQRLHRGEADEKDQIIAASHDELKRKMELSAKGIFEENPPNGQEPGFALYETPASFARSDSEQSSEDPLSSNAFAAAPPGVISPTWHNEATGYEIYSDIETDASEIDEEVARIDNIRGLDSRYETAVQVAPRPYIHVGYNEAAYYQTQASVTQTFAYSNTPSAPESTQYFCSQPRFTNQRFHNPHSWQTEQEEAVQAQQWTSQMYQALPMPLPLGSSQTPILHPGEVAPYGHQTSSSSSNVDYMSSDESDAYADTPGLNLFSSNFDAYAHNSTTMPTMESEPQLQFPRTNVNMFTRQARENGVIGGNNNYSEAGSDGGRRRNMFDRA